MAAIRIVVEGRVQGVGFRQFTKTLARSSGIRGEVWNRNDGGVEIVAEHESGEVLDAFAKGIERGPGYVRSVYHETAVERGFKDFSVGSTR